VLQQLAEHGGQPPLEGALRHQLAGLLDPGHEDRLLGLAGAEVVEGYAGGLAAAAALLARGAGL
jgi:hypothetical protein